MEHQQRLAVSRLPGTQLGDSATALASTKPGPELMFTWQHASVGDVQVQGDHWHVTLQTLLLVNGERDGTVFDHADNRWAQVEARQVNVSATAAIASAAAAQTCGSTARTPSSDASA